SPNPNGGRLASLYAPSLPLAKKTSSAFSASSTVTCHSKRWRPPAGTIIVCSASPTNVTPVACKLATTFISSPVLLLTTAANVTASPTTKKRGVTGRTSNGFVLIRSNVSCPTSVSPSLPLVTARASNRHVVRLSGSVTSNVAVPFASVTSVAFQ